MVFSLEKMMFLAGVKTPYPASLHTCIYNQILLIYKHHLIVYVLSFVDCEVLCITNVLLLGGGGKGMQHIRLSCEDFLIK